MNIYLPKNLNKQSLAAIKSKINHEFAVNPEHANSDAVFKTHDIGDDFGYIISENHEESVMSLTLVSLLLRESLGLRMA